MQMNFNSGVVVARNSSLRSVEKHGCQVVAARPSSSSRASLSVLRTAQLDHIVTEDEPAATTTASAASRCPVLAGLHTPPRVAVPFWQRIMQFKNPPAFHGKLLADDDVVITPAQIGFPELVVLGKADMQRAVLGRDGDLAGRTAFFSLGELIDHEASSFMETPAMHRQWRAMMQPAFSAEAINGPFLPEIVSIISQTLEQAAGKGQVPGYNTMKRMTFKIITTVMMGKAYSESEVDKLHLMYMDYTGGMGRWPQWNVPFTAYGRAMKARQELLKIFWKDFEAAKAAAARGEHVPGQLGVMINARTDGGNPLPDNFIVELMLTLLFAGHDTTSTSITGLAAVLQDHPEVVEKLRAEQRELVAKYGPGVTTESIREMTYADAVIRESLRYRPIASELVREALRDFEMGGYLIPKGSLLSVPIGFAQSHDPRWEGLAGDLSPDAFNPERMLTPEGQRVGDQLTFGHGPRYCLGAHLAMAEMKVFLALLAQGYMIEADTNTEWEYTVGRTPINGLPLVVQKL